MPNQNFFDESREQSLIKAKIVADYFWVWAKVIIGAGRHRIEESIRYIDLFAGPGRFLDGTKSTPILVLERAVTDPEMRKRLITVFNDADPSNSESLETAIGAVPDIQRLTHQPIVYNRTVGSDIVDILDHLTPMPTLFFVDPFGYKGLSLRLINSVLKLWGSDCIFFFNYNRINMGLNNPIVEEHMNALFGSGRANNLRTRLAQLDPSEREFAIVEELAQALKEMGGRYVLPFRFKRETGQRTSHHLVFVSKSAKGYSLMKEIMAKASSEKQQGVASFEYNPATERQPLLFSLSQPLSELKNQLLVRFAGKTLSMGAIYEQHNEDTPFVERNYKDALIELEAEGLITVEPPATKRRPYQGKASFGEKVMVTFPNR